MHVRFWLENPKRRHNLEDTVVDGRVVLKQALKK
jgi:hypothetical protein